MENKNFGLTESEFQQMLEDLKKNDTKLFEAIFLAQFSETMDYLKHNYSAQHTMAYDATMNALLDFRERFVSGKLRYGNLRFLFTRMASQQLLKLMNKDWKAVGAEFPEIAIVDEEILPEEDMAIFRKVWSKIGEECKDLLTRHFYGQVKLTEIAAQFNLNPAAVRKRKERCLEGIRSKLKQFLNL